MTGMVSTGSSIYSKRKENHSEEMSKKFAATWRHDGESSGLYLLWSLCGLLRIIPVLRAVRAGCATQTLYLAEERLGSFLAAVWEQPKSFKLYVCHSDTLCKARSRMVNLVPALQLWNRCDI